MMLINVQNKHLAQSKDKKSLFTLENHYPSLLSPLPLPTSKNKINLKTLSCLLLPEIKEGRSIGLKTTPYPPLTGSRLGTLEVLLTPTFGNVDG